MSLVELRTAAYERSRGYCEHCGQRLDLGWQLHHRLAGGMGGSSADRDRLSNVLAVRALHHNLAPDSIHMMGEASRANGWLISQHDRRDPSQVPVRYMGGREMLLDDTGAVLPVERPRLLR